MMKWPGKRRKLAIVDWLKFATDDELETLVGLTDLSKLGPLPSDAASLNQEIRARAETRMRRSQSILALASPDSVTDSADMSFAGWLKFKWQSADTSVRSTLRTVAEALGVSVPMTRARKSSVGGKDLPPIRRTKTKLQPKGDDSELLERPAEAEPEDRYDGPQWSDDDALDWEPCESLHEAFRSDADWY